MLRNLTISKGKSRRDDILLTAGFNLRKQDTANTHTSPAWDDTCIVFTTDNINAERSRSKVSSHAGLRDKHSLFLNRRLKSTVNRVPSLRDLVAEHSRSMRENDFSKISLDMLKMRNIN